MIKQYLDLNLSQEDKDYMNWEHEQTQSMIHTLDNNLVHNNESLGLPYWAKQNPSIVKRFTYIMIKNKLGTTKVKRKWSEFRFNIELLDQSKLLTYRSLMKMEKYTCRLDEREQSARLVKSNGKIKETGLNRLGFAISAKRTYKLDTAYITKYRELIKSNLIKSITKGIALGKIKDKFLEDKANYDEVTNYVLDFYTLDNEREYNNEYNISDSRGRAIFQSLKRIGNVISDKDFRAMLRVDKPIIIGKNSEAELNDIYYFIAELIGSKAKTEATKIRTGKKYYNAGKLPELCADELHERIWLERIYEKLDKINSVGFVRWDIPLEVDASMSIAQIAGALTNDERLLQRTNVIGSEITDPWNIPGVRRLSAKLVGTPTFYGSSQSAVSLLRSKNQSIIPDELHAIRQEFNEGGLSVLKGFKNALINGYSKHTPNIHVNIWDDSFTVEVNKWKQASSTIVVTEVYTTRGYKKSFTHEPVLIPDYDYMKLYWATCLIHNLDSQIMNKILIKLDQEWILSIHDAAIALPGVCGRIRKSYAIELKQINIKRKSILLSYRKSIGATSMKDSVAFMKLDKSIQQAPDVEYNACAMK